MNLLITGAWQQTAKYISTVEQLGHKVLFLQFETDELPCSYDWVEGIIGNGIFLTHPIEKFVNLRYIQLTSAGYDRVPMEYVKHHNIKINNARGVYSIPMAEFAISGVLQLYKKAEQFRKNQKAHTWNKQRKIIELSGKTVFILGCGSVGTECAKRFSAFGCYVIGADICVRNDDNYRQMVFIDEIDKFLQTADIVVLTLPLTADTKYLMGEQQFSMLKNGAIIVNIARGAIIDTKAMIKYLGKLGGAVLDVFEDEPLASDSPLWDEDNVIITPHNSFIGDNNEERLAKVIIKNLLES